MINPFYALYVTHERRACLALEEKGFEVLFPTYLKWTRHGRQKALRATPLLPGYLFARIDPEDFHLAVTSEHVAYVVGVNGFPRSIPEDMIDALRECVSSGRWDEKPPATKARPRKLRAKGLASIAALLAQLDQPLAEAA